MNFEKFYVSNKNGKSNCVVRSLCKVLDKQYDDVYNDLINVSKELKCSSFNDIEVFEKYMENNDIFKINCENITRVKDFNLDKGTFIVFCYDKKDFYHMVPIINNVIYDKNKDCLDLYILSVYKKK